MASAWHDDPRRSGGSSKIPDSPRLPATLPPRGVSASRSRSAGCPPCVAPVLHGAADLFFAAEILHRLAFCQVFIGYLPEFHNPFGFLPVRGVWLLFKGLDSQFPGSYFLEQVKAHSTLTKPGINSWHMVMTIHPRPAHSIRLPHRNAQRHIFGQIKVQTQGNLPVNQKIMGKADQHDMVTAGL